MYVILLIFISIPMNFGEVWFDRIAERMKVGGPQNHLSFADITPLLGKFSENTSFCMEHCKKNYVKSLSHYINNPDYFDVLPFVAELVNNKTNMALFCNHLRGNTEKCLSDCGLIHPEQYQPLPHNFICDNSDEMVQLSSCIFNYSSGNYLKNCTAVMKESLNDIADKDNKKCRAFNCFDSCLSDCDKKAVDFVRNYFSFVAEKTLILYQNVTTYPSACHKILPFPFYFPRTKVMQTGQTCKCNVGSNKESSGIYWCGMTIRNILLGTLVPFIVLQISVGLLFYYWYQKKWYVYQQIQRITADQIEIEDKQNPLEMWYFSAVYKATMTLKGSYLCGIYFPTNKSFPFTVAVKMLLPTCNLHDEMAFRDEAILLSKLSHENIVKTMGICMDSRPIMLALEFCDGGSLHDYLHKDEVQEQITTDDLYSISVDILQACCYLYDRHFIHRDLSAKNCQIELQGDNLRPRKVKLSGFDLAKDLGMNVDYSSRKLVFPIAYTAPEGFENKFSSKSDVWSYGVVLWEIWSWASIPFTGCYVDDNHMCTMQPFSDTEQIRLYVCVEQYSLADWQTPCQANFSFRDVNNFGPLENIMKLCWQFEPINRPNFVQLLKVMKAAKSIITRINLKRNLHDEGHLQQSSSVLLEQDENEQTYGELSEFKMETLLVKVSDEEEDAALLLLNETEEMRPGLDKDENPMVPQQQKFSRKGTLELEQNGKSEFHQDGKAISELVKPEDITQLLQGRSSQVFSGFGQLRDPTVILEDLNGKIISGFEQQSKNTHNQFQSLSGGSCEEQEATVKKNSSEDNKELCSMNNTNSEMIPLGLPEHCEFIEMGFFDS